MTSRPRLATDLNYRNGVGALLLFAVLAWTFVQAPLSRPQGFGEGSITRSIGFALFDMLELVPEGHGETESFLVAFIIIAVVLDAALDGAVMLARREEDGSVVTAIATDGGLPIGSTNEAESADDESSTDALETSAIDAPETASTADAAAESRTEDAADGSAGGAN